MKLLKCLLLLFPLLASGCGFADLNSTHNPNEVLDSLPASKEYGFVLGDGFKNHHYYKDTEEYYWLEEEYLNNEALINCTTSIEAYLFRSHYFYCATKVIKENSQTYFCFTRFNPKEKQIEEI